MSDKTTNAVPVRTTVYLDPKVKRGVQYYALRDDSSLSKVINDRLVEYLEDEADTMAVRAALEDQELPVSLSQAAKELGFDIHDIRRKAKAEVHSAA